MSVGGKPRLLEVEPDGPFFSRYRWCLDPVLPIRELRTRLQEEWERRQGLNAAWQRSEARVNLYLFLSAMHCAGADYLAHRPWNLTGLARRSGSLQPLICLFEAVANSPYVVATTLYRRRVEKWNGLVARCVDAACRILVDEVRYGQEQWQVLEAILPRVIGSDLPEAALAWRMRIPEAFRCQDLTHDDALSLARRLVALHGALRRSTLVVGPRTAGAYFAPLVETYLAAQGVPTLGWLSVRPKARLTRSEQRRLTRTVKMGGRIVVVDDHPNSGDTFVRLVDLLQGLGARAQDILILAPDHPARTDWTRRVQPVETITLPLEESYKARLLRDDERLLALVRELHSVRGWQDIRLVASGEIDFVNQALAEQFGHTFQTRLKRVIEVHATEGDGAHTTERLLVKSVGWGWLGYHAYLAGVSLAGHVPQVIGLREGLMFSEWVGPLDPALRAAPDDAVQAKVPAYVAQRVKVLPLTEDPWMTAVGYRPAGWDEVLTSLRQPFGRICGRLAAPMLKKELQAYSAPSPTLVDGQMALENWLVDRTRVVKADFEHHNFGGGEQDFVDPAFDLVGALLEMHLSDADEDRMIEAYIRASGDDRVRARLPLYKLHAGIRAMESAVYGLGRRMSDDRRERENLRYLAGRNFLTYQFNRHHAGRIERPSEIAWTGRLFFLDLDGVFDTQTLGSFPHTTTRGLLGLSLLRKHGYSVAPNTGRSVEHVRDYCQQYALPGGLAEYGCVFVDRVGRREIVLADKGAQAELARCREVLRAQCGIFVDPGYQVAVRAYRFGKNGTIGPSKEELEELLTREGFKDFYVVVTSADGYVLPKGVSKAAGIAAVKQLLGVSVETVAAMGDSDPDLDMLQGANVAYAPRNCSASICALARSSGKVRLVRAQHQRAFLAAVQDLIQRQDRARLDRSQSVQVRTASVKRSVHLIDRVLDVVDEPALKRWLRTVRARVLGRRLGGWLPSA